MDVQEEFHKLTLLHNRIHKKKKEKKFWYNVWLAYIFLFISVRRRSGVPNGWQLLHFSNK